jgi:hypothetical protein
MLKQKRLHMTTKRDGELISLKALDQIRQHVDAIVREWEIRSLIKDGANIDEDGNDLDELEAQEIEMKEVLEELGRGEEWEKIRSEACRRFPVRKWAT